MCSYLCPCDLEKISEDARNDWLHVKYTKALRLKFDRCIQGPVDLGDVDLQEALLKLKDRANSRDEIDCEEVDCENLDLDDINGQLQRRLQRGRDTAREIVKDRVEDKIKDKIEDKLNENFADYE